MMNGTTRNPYIGIVKFILSCMVVFIHFMLPGIFGEVVNCLARIAVPFFFLVSGFYSYSKEASVLLRRLKRNLGFLIGFSLLYLLWGIIKAVFITQVGITAYLRDTFTFRALWQFIILGVNPFSNHLWFLSALIMCYLFIILVRRNVPGDCILYVTMVIILSVFLVLSTVLPALGIIISHYYYRNGWLFGIPMFLIGMLIRKRQTKVPEAGVRMIAICLIIFVVGVATGIWQWLRFGLTDMPAGVFFASVSLFTVLVYLPNSVSRLGAVTLMEQASVWIYAVHKLVGEVLRCRMNESEYIFPVVVMTLSVLISLIIVYISLLHKKAVGRQ